MKFYITLLISILISNHTFSQEESYTPKGVNKLILKTGLSEKENIDLISAALKNNDILIEKFDTQTLQIQTSQRNAKQKNIRYMTYVIFFNVFQDKIFVSCKYSTNTNTSIAMYNTPISVTSVDRGSDLITVRKKRSYKNSIFNEMKSVCLDIVDESKLDYNFINQSDYLKFIKKKFN